MYEDVMRTLKWIGPFLVLLCLAHNVHADSQTLCPPKCWIAELSLESTGLTVEICVTAHFSLILRIRFHDCRS